MRHSHFAKAFAIVPVALALCITPAGKAADNVGCSVGSLYGTFADKDTGVIITGPNTAPLPFAGVNAITFDGSGNMTATGFGTVGGSGAPQTESGTYTVNPDCTGTYTVTINPGAITVHAFFVIDDGLNELQIIITDPGNVITCVARRQFPVGR
ncbi:MAG TPA: hypothetical protein VMB25_14845 [Bryobacteraceae bacterium]|nr:hypothetical protein [Bryobacteraceae bacterium]